LARESDNWLGDRPHDDQASTELYAPTRGLVGTPAYMAPELFEGGRATPASDQFAFCVALFVALFDKHPFKAGEGIALSELVTRVRAATLQVPALTTTGDERLFAVLRRGLSAEPSARFPDILSLLAALERAQRASSGRRLALAVVALLLVLLVLGLGFRPEARSEAALVAPTAAPVASSAPRALAAPRPEVGVAPSAALLPSPAPSTNSAPPGKRRPAPKPGDVRYKDWLKEPF
jgi:serine/threonine protein kinase